MWTYSIRPYIRRFKNEAGCILSPHLAADIDFSFGGTMESVWKVMCRSWENREAILASEAESVITPLIELSNQLNYVRYVEKIVGPSELAGQCISNRWSILKHPERAVLLELADE
jgi:hypothetical protein